MILSLLRRRRRAKLLAAPFPDEWLGYLERNVPLYLRLKPADQARLRDDLRVIVAEKQWEGCGGLAMTDEIKVTIAAHAALLLVGIRHDYFARVMSILVYPSGFRTPAGWEWEDGILDGGIGTLGEAWYDGPVVLAWDSVLSGACNPEDGRNVVLHEFAHQLDYLDGVADGTPPLRTSGDYKKWQEVMTREYDRLKRESEYGGARVLDEYGATNHAEFFAVVTEAFFEKPREMYARHPELYAVVSEYYGQDPAALERSAEAAGATREPPIRRSRAAAKTAAHAAAVLNWPGWVRFWEIHPGVSREQALAPFSHHVGGIVGCVIMLLVGVAVCAAKQWRPYLYLLFPTLLLLAFVSLAVWLWAAVRWVDRHGAWGGQYRAPEPAEPPEETPAPPG